MNGQMPGVPPERTDPPPVSPEIVRQVVDWAIVSRRSIRAFLPTPVDDGTVSEILRVASYAATGVNIQPWHVHVLRGSAKERLSAAIAVVNDDPAKSSEHSEPYDYYPTEWTSPYIDRRRKVGWDLYGLLGIEKGDKARMHAQHGRNYRFFDAPVGLMFTVDRVMQLGGFMDSGMFLQNVMVAARARGLDTCPQVAFTKFHRVIRDELDIASNQLILCGMSLGFADLKSPENSLVTERVPVEAFTTFHGQ